MSEDVLARICGDTRAETSRRSAAVPLAEMRARAIAASPPRGFHAALERAAGHRPALIAEIKRASPSGGMIRPAFAPALLAAAYDNGGAACLSVLTDGPYFKGSLDDFTLARAAVTLPVLRKDFILDSWQIYESRAHGADCILLIAAALTDAEMAEFEELSGMLGMAVLVEVHDRAELDRALKLNTRLLGINNRNLKTLLTDLSTTGELARHVPPDRILVAESGIRTAADVRALMAMGARALLVGESLLRQPDLTAATRALLA